MKPKTSNLNANVLNEAYQRKGFKSTQSTKENSFKRSRSRGNSYSSYSSYSSDDSFSSDDSRHAMKKSRKPKENSKQVRKQKQLRIPNNEESPANLEKRRKRFQPIETSTTTLASELEPVSGKEFVGTMMTMEKEYFRLTCVVI